MPSPRAFAPDTRIRFKAHMRPVASTLPDVMTVFTSSSKVTTVLVDGRPQFLATVALERA